MKRFRHTPAPWAIGFHDGSGSGKESNEGAYINVPTHPTSSDDSIITIVRGGSDDWGLPVGVVGRDEQEKHANARLIAASPELAQILQEILPYAEQEYESLRECNKRDGDCEDALAECGKWIDKARAVIKKIKGGSDDR